MQIKRGQSRLTSQQGLTLVEVVVVIVIIAVVTSIVWVAVAGRVKGAARREVLKSDLRQIVVAVNLYRADNDDGMPSNWRSFGYYGVNRKDKFGKGFPPQDVSYDKPPAYDVSYHTPECAAPPTASPTFFLFRQSIEAFASRPRANSLDLEHTLALRFHPACLAGSFGKHPVQVLRDGKVRIYQINHVKSIGADLSGSIHYGWWPDWSIELQLGN